MKNKINISLEGTEYFEQNNSSLPSSWTVVVESSATCVSNQTNSNDEWNIWSLSCDSDNGNESRTYGSMDLPASEITSASSETSSSLSKQEDSLVGSYQIHKGDLPSFLKQGNLFQSLSSDEFRVLVTASTLQSCGYDITIYFPRERIYALNCYAQFIPNCTLREV